MVNQASTQTLNGAIALDDSAIREFKSHLRGELIQPSDASYEEARRIYNGMIDKHPALIARCADVAFVTASAEENPDLYWAIRGGGGNFGVVTSFLFRLHPISMVYAGPMLWHLDRAAEAMRLYREVMHQAPDDLNGFFAFLVVP